jgi:hypothetical protein
MRRVASSVTCQISISLDGFVAGPRQSPSPEVTHVRYRIGGYSALVALTENTGGKRVANADQLAPASPEPKTSPDVAPK